MLNKRIMVLAVSALVLLFTGCGHEHNFKEATCKEPQTCTICGKTQGEPAGHVWKDADCQNPKTCVICGETEGDVGEHVWKDADCVNPKTCSLCGATEGEALGHTTEVVMCKRCGELADPELVDKLRKAIEKFQEKETSAREDLTAAPDFSTVAFIYTYTKSGADKLDMAKEYLKDVEKYCGNYKELNSLKQAAVTLKKKLSNLSAPIKDLDSITRYFKQIPSKEISDFYNECAEFYRSLIKE